MRRIFLNWRVARTWRYAKTCRRPLLESQVDYVVVVLVWRLMGGSRGKGISTSPGCTCPVNRTFTSAYSVYLLDCDGMRSQVTAQVCASSSNTSRQNFICRYLKYSSLAAPGHSHPGRDFSHRARNLLFSRSYTLMRLMYLWHMRRSDASKPSKSYL